MKIEELTLYTKHLTAQKDFYAKVLGLDVYNFSKDEVTFKVGDTLLRFIGKDIAHPYHFAFNIPANQVQEALIWLKDRVAIQCDGTEEIVDFPAWNAESIYFYDADGNILEFIARKNLKTSTHIPFSDRSLFEISEIGLATSEFDKKYYTLLNELGLDKFGGGKEVFAAFGSEHGLFILIDKTRKNWFPTNDKAYAADFIVKTSLHGKKIIIEYKNETLSFKRDF